MPLSEEEKSKRRNRYQERKDELNKKRRENYEENKEDILKINKEFYEKNKSKLLESQKIYRENHKEERKEYLSTYSKEEKAKSDKKYRQTPAGKKARIIAHWKKNGLIHDNYDELYTRYLSATNCEVCRKEFIDSFDRCMDHCHETGLFRQFLCRSCNNKDSWKNKV